MLIRQDVTHTNSPTAAFIKTYTEDSGSTDHAVWQEVELY